MQQQTEPKAIMIATIKPVLTLLQNRLNNRLDALNALSIQPMDNIPREIAEIREAESAKIRAVVQEQRDLIEILKVIYPDV